MHYSKYTILIRVIEILNQVYKRVGVGLRLIQSSSNLVEILVLQLENFKMHMHIRPSALVL